MKLRFIATGSSKNSLKFDDLGTTHIKDNSKVLQELEILADEVARVLERDNKRRREVHVFMDDQDMACYSVRARGGEVLSTRNYEEAAKTARSVV